VPVSAVSDADRLRLLGEIGEVADGTRLLGETVQRLLDILVPRFADVATLDIVSLTGEMRRLGARVDRPRDQDLEEGLLHRHQSGDERVGVLRAVATGESQLLAPVEDALLSAIATGEDDLRLLRELGLHATMYVPLRARGRVLGVLACSLRHSDRAFGEEDLRFAEALAGRIGLALDNAGLSETVSTLESRLEATLAHLAAAVVVREPSGRMAFANPAAAEVLGADSVEELFSTRAEQLMARFEAYDEQGRPLTLDELPSARALRGERPEPLLVRSTFRPTGRVRWLLHKATPVFGDDGSLVLAVNVIEDLTDEKRAELAQRLLAEAGRELASSLDYQQTLQRVARLAVPELADWCGVSIRGAGDVLEQVAVAHVDPGKVALARELGQRYPTRLDNPSGAAQVIRTGRSQLVPVITDEVLAASAATPGQLALIREIGMRAAIIVPLAIPGREPFGTLSLVMAESGRALDEEDVAVAEELGRRAAIAVENARLYTERSRIAQTLQHSLLPPELPQIAGFRLASLYRPAGEQAQVGGDFYDAFPVPGGWLLVVGDVAGHGAEAAALTSMARHSLRMAARLLDDPLAALEQLNEALCERSPLSLVSLCCAHLTQSAGGARAQVLLAGHPPALHVRAEEVAAVGRPARLLGLPGSGRWAPVEVTLEPGDLLVFYTDGVVDTFGESERFGEDRLAETLRGARDAGGAVARIDGALSAFGRGLQRDDTAVLAVERRVSD
jgi:PAS domain S-box-containing protein